MRKLALLLALLVVFGVGVTVSAAAPTADPACPGSLLPQLTTTGANSVGHVNHIFSTLRVSPDGPAKQVFFAPSNFTVTAPPDGGANPRCATSVWFWYVKYDSGEEGWASESQTNSIWGANQFWLVPGTVEVPPPAPFSCPLSLPVRLHPGDAGQIAQAFSTLFDEPNGTVIERVSAPATFHVLNIEGETNPVCDLGVTFFHIQYDASGKSGWASESQTGGPYGSSYYLELVPPPPPPPPAG